MNQPNNIRNLSEEVFLAINLPAKTPAIAAVVVYPNNVQLIEILPKSDANPAIELIAMINNDVLIASFISNPSMNISAGIIRNPPPAPRKPVMVPTIIAHIKSL